MREYKGSNSLIKYFHAHRAMCLEGQFNDLIADNAETAFDAVVEAIAVMFGTDQIPAAWDETDVVKPYGGLSEDWAEDFSPFSHYIIDMLWDGVDWWNDSPGQAQLDKLIYAGNVLHRYIQFLGYSRALAEQAAKRITRVHEIPDNILLYRGL